MISQEVKERIDNMTVGDLLLDNRGCKPGDVRYQGEEGKYRVDRLAELRSEDEAAYVRASKAIGWE